MSPGDTLTAICAEVQDDITQEIAQQAFAADMEKQREQGGPKPVLVSYTRAAAAARAALVKYGFELGRGAK